MREDEDEVKGQAFLSFPFFDVHSSLLPPFTAFKRQSQHSNEVHYSQLRDHDGKHHIHSLSEGEQIAQKK